MAKKIKEVEVSRDIISSYISKWDGDKVTVSKIGSSTVVEIEINEDRKKIVDDDSPPPVKEKKIKKDERIAMIKEMLKAKKSREEIKKAMYDKLIYKGNPNPASAFAGDWKAAN